MSSGLHALSDFSYDNKIYLSIYNYPIPSGIWVRELDTQSQGYKTAFILPSTYGTSFAFIALMKMQRDIKGLHIVSREF